MSGLSPNDDQMQPQADSTPKGPGFESNSQRFKFSLLTWISEAAVFFVSRPADAPSEAPLGSGNGPGSSLDRSLDTRIYPDSLLDDQGFNVEHCSGDVPTWRLATPDSSGGGPNLTGSSASSASSPTGMTVGPSGLRSILSRFSLPFGAPKTDDPGGTDVITSNNITSATKAEASALVKEEPQLSGESLFVPMDVLSSSGHFGKGKRSSNRRRKPALQAEAGLSSSPHTSENFAMAVDKEVEIESSSAMAFINSFLNQDDLTPYPSNIIFNAPTNLTSRDLKYGPPNPAPPPRGSTDLDDLARVINKRTESRQKKSHLLVANESSMEIFANGHKLKAYQAEDLQRLLKREMGEEVCGTDVVNNIGFMLAYPMGFGKTVTAIALILLHPAPGDFKGSKSTLVLVPSQDLIDQWKSEILKFAPQLEICVYSSSSVNADFKEDGILLTYAQLRYQHQYHGPIYRHHFWRVIGDEFHVARNPQTKTADCLLALSKQHGLCLTGTPIQNSWLDIWTALRFLGVTYEKVDDLQTYRKNICSKFKRGITSDPLAQEHLNIILNDFAIFRHRFEPNTGRELVTLPKRMDENIMVNLSAEERKIYEIARDLPKSQLDKIMRRRQACDHPLLLVEFLTPSNNEGGYHETDSRVGDAKTDPRDKHTVSISSLPEALQRCFSETFVSSKLGVMRDILKGRLSGSHKSIIFTNFTKFFPPIRHTLRELGIPYVEYNGDMTTKQRKSSLRSIAEDPSCLVIVVSTTAGALGLNISSCDTVIILEPWWNPYVEDQAIARSHRIGQTRPVRVYRLYSKGTIEEAIMETQTSKHVATRDLYGHCYEPDERIYKTWLAAS